MDQHFHRRDFLRISTLAAALPIAVKLSSVSQAAQVAPVQKAAGDDTTGLTTYELGPQIWIRYNNRPLSCYRAHRSQKYPYMFPLSGPVSGLSLTDETTLPYPHHRSLFFGCDRVNGGNYWQEGYETGQIRSNGPKVVKTAKDLVEIADSCEWQKPGGPVILRDSRRVRITVPGEHLRFIDWQIHWHAVEDIVVQKTNHALFSIRASLDITPKGGGVLVNAEGDTGEKGTFGKNSAWCGFYGPRSGMPNLVEGIAILDHPKNPWAPTPWFTRDYGFASPTPFNFIDKSWGLAAGKSVSMNYRVVLHAGSPKEAGMDRIFQQWVSQPS